MRALIGRDGKGPSGRPAGARREGPPARQSQDRRGGPTAEPGNLASSQPEGDAPPPTPAAERRGGSGAPSGGKPARRKRRTQEKGVRKWPVRSRTETQQPGCPADRGTASAARAPGKHTAREALSSAPPLPRLPAPPPPPPPKPLWELRAARSREAGALERRGGAALPASPPARAAPQPGAYSPPPPPPPSLSLLATGAAHPATR